MIALCREHHDEADGGNFTTEKLRQLKRTKHSIETVKGSFPSWEQKSILVRLGGNYCGGSSSGIAVNGQPLVGLSKTTDGLLNMSFTLWDESGDQVLRVKDNDLELFPTRAHDFVATVQKKSVKLWLGERDIGLDLSFKLMTERELDVVLEKDFTRGQEEFESLLRKKSEETPDYLLQYLEEARVGRGKDPTGFAIRSWVRENRVSDGGRIPFFDFKNLSLFFGGKRLRIRNGLAFEGTRILYCACFGNAGGGINLNV